ncbi:MAG: ornithine cyclodeaminase family protein, partial [Spirochaetales bacterium]|nr:ornithine cyclodeaminase family protein [Spirochaetales bacterium]
MEKQNIYIVNETELKALINLDKDIIERVETAFLELENGNASVPPIMMIPVPEKTGEVDIKSAYIKGLPSLAVKIASGFFENSKLGLPSASGQMLVLNAETGFLQAVLLDNGYLTQVRTGAAGAIAAKYLAPKQVKTAGVIGCGTQARYQMRGLYLVRPFQRLLMFSLDSDAMEEAYVRDMESELGVEVVRAGSAEEVLRSSDAVVTTTPARNGYIKKEWLHPGLHITAMGCDTEEKQELQSEVLGAADILACDLKTQVYRLGEMRSALEAGVITKETPLQELGAIIKARRAHKALSMAKSSDAGET